MGWDSKRQCLFHHHYRQCDYIASKFFQYALGLLVSVDIFKRKVRNILLSCKENLLNFCNFILFHCIFNRIMECFRFLAHSCLETSLYKPKSPTNTGPVLHYKSNVDDHCKRGSLKTTLDRALSRSSNWSYFSSECDRLKWCFLD